MAQQPTAPQSEFQKPASSTPVLVHRRSQNETPGRIKLDVVVTDSAGNRVSGLQLKDFTLLDNRQPEKILAFRAFDGAVEKAQPSEVILLLDTVNLPFTEVAMMRQQMAKFLRQDGGHLAVPVSILVFSDKGLITLDEPSTDGNTLAAEIENGSALRIIRDSSYQGGVDRFQLSLKVLANIVDRESIRQGRKLLIWIGPGWPLLAGMYADNSLTIKQKFFDFLVFLSTRLREAHIALYTVADARDFEYREYLKGVKSATQADAPNQSLEALAFQSGGRILGPSNDVAGQINQCVADADSFYKISFNPPRPEHPNEFHELKVQIDRPGLTARTATWYYIQPKSADFNR
jgi:VWFA-related protein